MTAKNEGLFAIFLLGLFVFQAVMFSWLNKLNRESGILEAVTERATRRCDDVHNYYRQTLQDISMLRERVYQLEVKP